MSQRENDRMRTLIIIVGGLVLLAVFGLIGHWSGRGLRGMLPYFIVLWLIAAGINMWIGVARAGYSVAEELPIFLLIFGVPAAVALLLNWWTSRATP
jgi:uncharacterized membrane protein YadS